MVRKRKRSQIADQLITWKSFEHQEESVIGQVINLPFKKRRILADQI